MLNNNWVGKLAFAAWDAKEGGHRSREYKALKKHQYLTPRALHNYQALRLNTLLQHAWTTSRWYQPRLEQAGYAPDQTWSAEDLQRLPITTKADIRDNTDLFISTAYEKSTLVHAKTGGSTGVSLNLYFDSSCQALRNAAQMYADNLAGWNVGDRMAAVWGNPPIPSSAKAKLRAQLLERMIYLDTMDLNPRSMDAFIQQWQRYQPQMIFGHAHSIYIFANYLLENHIETIRPKGIVATSMMLLAHERDAIERACKTSVTNRYGCEEVGLIAVECEQHHGMHINSPHIVLESLDAMGDPAPAGEPGKLVITDLNNLAMPLFRYRVEDVGILSDRRCSCGRTTPLLERLEGRVADFLKKPDGGQVAGVSLVERTLTKVPGVAQMQLLQEDLYEVQIKRVKGLEFTNETDQLLIQEFRTVFPTDVALTIKNVDRIDQEASGKYRFSICRI